MTRIHLTPDGGAKSHIKTLSSHIQKTFNINEDVNIHCKDQTIVKANRLMLASSSHFIRSILASDHANFYLGLPHDLICPDFDSLALMQVLELISSGDTFLNSKEASAIKEIQSIIKCLKLNIQLSVTLEEVGQGKI